MIVYRSTVAVEKDTRFLDRFHILFSDADSAWNVLMDTLFELSDIAGTEDYVFAFSDPDHNFRKDLIGDDYKANREGVRKPLAYWDTRARVEETFESLWKPKLEADDTMGLLMTGEGGEDYILWSLDKDLKQIPGRRIDDDEVIVQPQALADRFFYTQILAGDPVDGYPGCPGFGMDTAERVLRKGVKFEPYTHELKSGPRKGQTETRFAEVEGATPWETILSSYAKAGQTEDDALYNARMARILRDGEYVNNKVRLWTP